MVLKMEIFNYIVICTNIRILGATSMTNIGTSFIVFCGRGNNVCDGALINCAQGMDCLVDCNGGCKNGTINAPIGHNLIVECGDNNSCQYTHINGQNSSGLNITCKDYNSCKDTIVNCLTNRDAPCVVNIQRTEFIRRRGFIPRSKFIPRGFLQGVYTS